MSSWSTDITPAVVEEKLSSDKERNDKPVVRRTLP